jgi:hypothetical protein
MTGRADRPLCLLAADGHVLSMASTEQARVQLRRHYAALTALDVGGTRLETLPWEKAVAGHVAGNTCPRCVLVYACGCTPDAVAAGRCGHGTLGLVQQVMRTLPPA